MNNFISTYNDAYLRGEAMWEWGSLNLYSLAMFFGFVFTFVSIIFHWRRMKYPMEILQILLIIVVPSSLLGARLWYVIAEGSGDSFFTFQGLSIHGGVAGACIFGISYAYTKRKIIDLRTSIGIIIPNVLLGQAIGRWGNFTNHEVYGSVVSGDSLNWLGSWMKSHMYIQSEGISEFRQPLFLYESIANFVGWYLIVWVLVNKALIKPGTGGALYLIWYGITRASMETLRDPADIMKIGGVAISFVLAICMIGIGLFFFVWWELYTKPFSMLAKKLKVQNVFDDIEYIKIRPTKEVKRIIFIKDKKIHFFKKVEKTFPLWLPAKDGKWIVPDKYEPAEKKVT